MKRFACSTMIVFTASVCLFSAGCKGTKHKVVPVEGKITFDDGTPLPAGTKLLLNPNEGRMGTASATTDGTGAFKVTHVGGQSGAEVGKYVVLLQPPENDADAFTKLMHKDYYNGGYLTIDVTEGMGPVDLKVIKLK